MIIGTVIVIYKRFKFPLYPYIHRYPFHEIDDSFKVGMEYNPLAFSKPQARQQQLQ